MVALGGALSGCGSLSRATLAGDRLGHRPRPSAPVGSPVWLVPSVLLVGLFAGYLVGSVRVAALVDSALQSRIGSDRSRPSLVITGQVRSHGGWQSATAVVQERESGCGVGRRNRPLLGGRLLEEALGGRAAATGRGRLDRRR